MVCRLEELGFMKIKYILVIAIIGTAFSMIVYDTSKSKMKALGQSTLQDNQMSTSEQKTSSDIPMQIALNREESSPMGGYRLIFIVIEEKYFIEDQLTRLFTAMADKYEYPMSLTIKAYSNEEEVKSAIKESFSPPVSKREKKGQTGIDDRNKTPKKKFFAEYRRQGFFTYGTRGEEIWIAPNPNSEKVKVVRLRTRTYPSGEIHSDLWIATMNGDAVAVKDLLSRGADANTKDRYGDTVLMIAALQGNSEMIRYLKEKGADVNAQNPEGDTALMYAVGSGKIDAIKQLLELGANPQIENNKYVTVFGIAERKKSSEIIQLLNDWSRTKQ
jgi:hypothetical protein